MNYSLNIRVTTRYLARYPEASYILDRISGLLPNIGPDIQKTNSMFDRISGLIMHWISGLLLNVGPEIQETDSMFDRISGIRFDNKLNIWFLPNIGPDIQKPTRCLTGYLARLLTEYPVYRLIIHWIFGLRPNIGPDIRNPTGCLTEYPVSGQIVDRISGI